MRGLWWVVLGWFGCTEQQIGTFNAPPDVSITSHAGGERVVEGVEITVVGRLGDADDPASELSASFTRDGLPACADVAPDADGEVRCPMRFDLGGGLVLLQGVDPDGASARATVQLDVLPNAAPTIDLRSPENGSSWFEGDKIPFEIRVADLEDPASALQVVVDSDVAGRLALDETPADTGEVVGFVTLSAGVHALSARVIDSAGKVSVATSVITVRPPNVSPLCAVTTPAADALLPSDRALVLGGTASDVDAASGELTFTWRSDRDGILSSGLVGSNGEILGSAQGLAPGLHVLSLVVTDAFGAVCTASVPVRLGVAPTVGFTAPFMDRGTEGPTWIALAVDDPDGDEGAATVTLSSSVDGVLGASNPASDGVIGWTADLTPGVHVLTATVTDADGFSATARTSYFVDQPPGCEIVSPSPLEVWAPETSGPAMVAVSDPDGTPGDVTVIWRVDGAEVARGASAPLIGLASGQIGLSVEVSDPLGGRCVDAVDFWQEAPPELSILSPEDGAAWATTGGVVQIAAVDAVDGQDGLAVTWLADGAVQGASVTGADGRAAWTFGALGTGAHTLVARVTDSFGASAEASVQVSVRGSLAPPGVRIAPDAPDTDDKLTAVVDDADPGLTYVFVWTGPDGVQVDGDEVPAALTTRGELWQVEAVAVGEEGAGPPGRAATRIGNAPPVLVDASVLPGPSAVGCAAGATLDADGDAVDVTFTVEINGAPAGAAPVDRGALSRGDAVVCVGTPDDGLDTGAPVRAAPWVVPNADPMVTNVEIVPETPIATDEIRCVYTFSDPDGDADHATVRWEVDGVDVGSGTLLAAPVQRGQVVTCVVWPSDGIATGAAVTDQVIIGDAAPTALAAEIQPETPGVGDTATCAVLGFVDVDGDAATTSFAWTLDGAPIGTGASVVVPGRGVLACAAQVAAGGAAGPVLFDQVAVTNRPPTVLSASIAAAGGGAATLTVSTEDLDGDPVSWTAAWTVDGEDAGVGASIPGPLRAGQVLEATITPFDGIDVGPPYVTGVTVLGDSPPSAAVVLTADVAAEAGGSLTTLTCAASGADVDGDAVSLQIWFEVDGRPLPATDGGSRSEVVTVRAAGAWRCGATPTAAGATGETVWSDLISVAGGWSGSAYALDLTPESVWGESSSERLGDSGCSVGYADVDGDGRDDLIVGSLDNDYNATAAGMVGVFLADNRRMEELEISAADVRIYGESTGARVGTCVAGVGDLDGDGLEEVAISGPDRGPSGYPPGKVYIFGGDQLRSGALTVTQSRWEIVGESNGDEFGFAFAGGGDLDGGGVPDLVIGAPQGSSGRGKIHLVSGESLDATRSRSVVTLGAITLTGENTGDRLGAAVAIPGDVDGDGLADAAVGAPGLNADGLNDRGATYVLVWPTLDGLASPAITNARWRMLGEAAYDASGSAIAGGDVDGDGLGDLVIGAYMRSQAGKTEAGKAYLFLGAALPAGRDVGLVTAHATVLGAASDWAGASVAVVADMDFDGGDEVLIGVPRNDGATTNAGAAWLYAASTIGAGGSLGVADADVVFLGAGLYHAAGALVAATGDRDGDGAGDFAIGAPAIDRGSSDAGAIYLWSGR